MGRVQEKDPAAEEGMRLYFKLISRFLVLGCRVKPIDIHLEVPVGLLGRDRGTVAVDGACVAIGVDAMGAHT